MRLQNTRINSINHVIHTINVNKLSLCAYDDKRYIFSDRITTLPFGHYSLRDEMFCNIIANDSEWGLETLTDSNNHMTSDTVGNQVESYDWAPPDMGFHQRNYTESELSEDLVDFDESTDVGDDNEDTAGNQFILFEASEDDNGSNSKPPNANNEEIVDLTGPSSINEASDTPTSSSDSDAPLRKTIRYSTTQKPSNGMDKKGTFCSPPKNSKAKRRAVILSDSD